MQSLLLFFSFSVLSDLCVCDSKDGSMPGFPVLHHLPELAQTHAHWVSDAIQPSHPWLPLFLLLSIFPSIRVFFQWVSLCTGGQSTGVLASASVLPMNIQSWFSLGLTGLIYLLSKELSRVFSSITIQKHQFFGNQPSLRSNPHITVS